MLLVVRRFPKFSETFIASKLRGLLDRGWDVHVACEQTEEDQWTLFPGLRTTELASRVHAQASVERLVKRLDIDVVHFEFGEIARSRIRQLENTNVATVVSFRGPDISYIGLDEEPFYADVWARADALHFAAYDMYRRGLARGCPAEMPVSVIPPGLSPHVSDFAATPRAGVVGTEARPLRVVMVSRLSWVKGFEYAFEALRLVGQQGVSVECRVVGDDPDFVSGKRQATFTAHDLGLRNVSFMGARPHREALEQMAWADVFLQASVSEAFSNSVLEAQAIGTPVVTSDAGGVPENVRDGMTGFVVPRRNPVALARKLIVLSRDPEKRRRFSAAGRERANSLFSMRRHVESFERTYLAVADVKAHRREFGDSGEAVSNPVLGLRLAVEMATPMGAVVAVVSKGDEEMVDFDGRTGWHFPQAPDGGYAGYHPGSDMAARRFLTAVVSRGAQFLAFPSSAFWWLDHYAKLTQHLLEQHRMVTAGPAVVFELIRGTAEGSRT